MEKHPGVTSTVEPGWGPRFGGGFRAGARPSLDVAARALGMTAADLKTALGNGQSLAAVAMSKNVDVQKVIDALTQDATSRIDAAVKAGKITQAQADTARQNLATRITDFVNRTFPAKGRRPGWGPGGGPGVTRTSFAA